MRLTDLNKSRGKADFNPSCAAVNNECYVLIGVYPSLPSAGCKADTASQLHSHVVTYAVKFEQRKQMATW